MKKSLLIIVIAVIGPMTASGFAQAAKPKMVLRTPNANVYPLQEGFVDAHGVLI